MTWATRSPSTSDCLVLNYAGQSVNTVADLGGFISESASTSDSLATFPLRYQNSDTVTYDIHGPGTFLIQALDDSVYTIVVNGGTPADAPSRNLSIWLLSIGRASVEATCPEGYGASWAEWPNNGKGGWVCDKYTYAYYPDEAVK